MRPRSSWWQHAAALVLAVLCPVSLAAQVPVLSQVYTLYTSQEFAAATFKLDAFRNGLDPREPSYPRIMARVEWQSAQILAAQGRFTEALKRSDNSISQARRALVQADIGAAIYQGERGKIYMKMGLVEQAHTDLETARSFLARVPGLAGSPGLEAVMLDFHRYEAMMLSEIGRVEEAYDTFSSLVDTWRPRNNPRALATALIDLAGAKLRRDTLGLGATEIAAALAKEAEGLIDEDDKVMLGDVRLLKGRIALQQSDLAQAAVLLSEAVALFEDPLRNAHATLLIAQVRTLQGDAVRSEQLHMSAMKDIRQRFGVQHPMLGRTLVGLGLVTADLGRPSEAISYLSRAVRVFEDGVGIGTPAAAEARVELAMIFNQVGEFSDARSVAESALETLAESQSDLRRAYAHSALGFALAGLKENEAAVFHLETAQREIARQRGVDGSDLAPGLIQLALLKADLGEAHISEAEAHLQDARRIMKKDASTGPRLVSPARRAEIQVLVQSGRPREAAARARDAIAYLKSDMQPSADSCDLRPAELKSRHSLLTTSIDTLAATENLSRDLLAELFEAAQLAHSGAASEAILHKARQRTMAKETRELLAKRKTLIAERCALNRELLHSISGVSRGIEVNRPAVEQRVAELERSLSEIRAGLPHTANLSEGHLSANTIGDIVRHLWTGESMLVQVTGETGTHLFWIDRNGLQYAKTDLDRATLSDHVQRLRSSINVSNVKKDGSLPAVPLDAAFSLYQGIFAPFAESMAQTETVIFVADGAARSIPTAMLLIRDYGRFAISEPRVLADLEWFGAHQAVSVIPSPAAFVALRQKTDRPVGTTSFVGVGNPTFAQERYALPDTEQELKSLAVQFSGTQPPILALGSTATEKWVRTSEKVREARILAFATHGLLSRELGVSEPALMLASNNTESDDEANDGFLTVSEIATLELKADWVILSACNTAAGRDDRAEGLSGLARSFFEAGARSLLVSHWYVPSSAAGALTVFMSEALAEPEVGRAEALRQSMTRVREGQTLDETTNPRFGHPAYWAPFVVVGDSSTPI